MSCFKFVLIVLGTFVIVSPSVASTSVPIEDDIYDELALLEAEGVIVSGLLNTKPLNQEEVRRLILEAEKSAAGKRPLIRQRIRSLKEKFSYGKDQTKHIKPIDVFYGNYLYTDSGNSELIYNNDGDRYEKGSQARLGVLSRAELGWVSLAVNPEIRYSESDTDLIVKRAYGTLTFFGLDLTFGKDSQWWGPGYHGALLLSNNPEPLSMIRLTNSDLAVLPSILQYLGLFKFTVFVTKLEKEREIPNPYLWGMRIHFKPNPFLELGLQRTAILGGRDRSEDFKTWVKSFTGKGENESGSGAGDQRAGLDVKLTLPLDRQPVQLYAEAAGEDEAGGLPSKWAYLAGIYLPRILSFERLGLRAEYATTHISGYQNVWYNHGIYKSGYRYKGSIIGHHMGTDSRDLFLEAQYVLPKMDGGRLYLSYDLEKHNLAGNIKENSDEYSMKVTLPFKKELILSTVYSYGRFRNLNNIHGLNKTINTVLAEIHYRF